MKLLAAALTLLFSLACSPATPADYPEPPFEWLVDFQINEIPGKAGLYYDIDADGLPDLVTAHTLIKVTRIEECPLPMKHSGMIIIGQECKTANPKLYVMERKIFAVRMIHDKWVMVTERTWRECRKPSNINLACRRDDEDVILVPKGE